MTESTGTDAIAGLSIIKTIKGKLASVTGDAVYDTVAVYKLAVSRHARVVVPPVQSASATCRGPGFAEWDRTIRRIGKVGRRRWKKESDYHQQGRVENTFYRYKQMLGGRLRAQDWDAQQTEVAIACKVLNRMQELGRPRSVAVAA